MIGARAGSETASQGTFLKSAAVFVDYENVKVCKGRVLFPDEVIDTIRRDLVRFGPPLFVNVYLAIGLPESQAPVSNGLMYRVFKAGGTVIQCPSFRNGTDSPKNLADPTAIIDIGESLFTHPEIGRYVLATGDKDFIPAVRKLRMYGKEVRLYHGDSLSSHLQQEIKLGLASEDLPAGKFAFPGVVNLADALERSIYPVSLVSRDPH